MISNKQKSPELPPIPDIPSELQHPIGALFNTANFLKELIAKAIIKEEALEVILLDQMELLQLTEIVLNSWDAKLNKNQ